MKFRNYITSILSEIVSYWALLEVKAYKLSFLFKKFLKLGITKM